MLLLVILPYGTSSQASWGGGCTLHQQLQHGTKKNRFWHHRPSNNDTKQGVKGHLQLWVSVDVPWSWGGWLVGPYEWRDDRVYCLKGGGCKKDGQMNVGSTIILMILTHRINDRGRSLYFSIIPLSLTLNSMQLCLKRSLGLCQSQVFKVACCKPEWQSVKKNGVQATRQRHEQLIVNPEKLPKLLYQIGGGDVFASDKVKITSSAYRPMIQSDLPRLIPPI